MNMLHFTRTSIFIFTFFSCFQATPLYIQESKVKYLITHVDCPPKSTFYAPTEVEPQCILAALDCVLRELNGTVIPECEDPLQYVSNTVEFLETRLENYHKGNHEPPKSSKCECERWQQTPFKEFVNKIESLFQQDNTAAEMMAS